MDEPARVSSASVQIVGSVMLTIGVLGILYGAYIIWQIQPGLAMSAEWTNAGAYVSTALLTAAVSALVLGITLAMRQLTASPLTKLGLVERRPHRRSAENSRRACCRPYATRAVCHFSVFSEYYCVAITSNKEWLWLPAASSLLWSLLPRRRRLADTWARIHGHGIGRPYPRPCPAQPVPAAEKAKYGKFGVDIEDGFKPYYIVDGNKKKTVADLKSALKKADTLPRH